MPYNPTWNNPYMPAQSPYVPNAPLGGQAMVPTYMGGQAQPVNGVEKVSGKDSLWQLPMPPNSVSKPYFDYNGKVFYIVNTDAAGAKTIETFDFWPHKEENPVQIDGAQFVSKQEYDSFVAKVSAALEALNGVHAAVPTTVPDAGLSGKDGAVALDAARGHAPADTAVR